MKLRTGDPWMPAPAFSATLRGVSINLLVPNIEAALHFQREVLGMSVVYSDPDFAVVEGYGSQFMLHADHTYDHHAFLPHSQGGARGLGIELRVYGCDPDVAEKRAKELGFAVLSPAANKGHGLSEAYILDADGYCWAPSVLVTPA